jgi:deoxyribose-phosphate aldolase
MKPMTDDGGKMAPLIDHTLLKPDATSGLFGPLCREAVHYGFAAVCVHPCRLELVLPMLRGSAVKPCVVVGFPLGTETSGIKAAETADSVARGAQEVDMVINIGALKDGDVGLVADDIRAVVRAAAGRPVKVIIETALLTETEKREACRLAKDAGAAFVKTCTGFSGGGATVEDIRLMRSVVGPSMGVKASGGIRTRQDAMALIAAGADRIGTSSGVAIVT